jgi:hypothetical protein
VEDEKIDVLTVQIGKHGQAVGNYRPSQLTFPRIASRWIYASFDGAWLLILSAISSTRSTGRVN